MEKRIGESGAVGLGLMRGLNLRPEEVERTLLMFAVYTFSSVGLIWLELSTVGLFLDEYGADKLPWIYIASAGIGSSLGVVYSRLQTFLPLRRVIVVILLLMAIPLFLFRFGLGLQNIKILGLSVQFATLFLMWLWVEACYLLNDLNTSITANQLFNIREIKRTYPIISSGFLVAGVVSGFSLPVLLKVVGLNNVTLVSGAMVLVSAGILFYLSQTYEQSFPDSSRWTPEDELPEFSTRSLKGPLQGYVIPLVVFFVMAEVLYVMVDFQFFSQLEYRSAAGGASGIVSFLGVFEGVLSTFQVATQWFASSRLVEKIGVFGTASVLPAAIACLGLFSLIGGITGLFSVFVGFFILRFLDELFHYTLIETTGAVLFQPLPENIRSDIQTLVNGVFEPLSTGLSGVGILALLGVTYWILPHASEMGFRSQQSLIFVVTIILLALVWLWVVWKIRSQYVRLLVRSAERGRLGTTDIDMKSLKRSVVEELKQSTPEADKRSCIELLTQLDPKNVGDTLVPLLDILPPALQHQALEIMLNYPNPEHLQAIRSLSAQNLPPEVLALALRYIWITESSPDVEQLRPYLQPQVDPVVRGTAAALIMRRGDREQKAAATNIIRRMIVSNQERERVMGVRALGDADYLQGLRLYLNDLLQDESLRVRCAVLEAIAATHMEEYYQSLLKAMSYRSTRDAARQALVRLGNEAIPLLMTVATDIYRSDLVRLQAWTALGEIATPEALDALIDHLLISWGTTRRNILRILLSIPDEAGIEQTLDRIGRNGLETLIEQELMFVGQLYAALLDFGWDGTPRPAEDGENAPPPNPTPRELLCRSVQNLEFDAVDRCFLLMKFLYSLGSIQAAAFNVRSHQQGNVARGLEILDNTVDITHKRALIGVLDNHSLRQKVEDLSPLTAYRPMEPSDRLRYLLELRHFLSDWTLACCFHQARDARWSLTAEQALMCLRHPKGFVREAVLAYLRVGARQALVELLPMLQSDRDPLVVHQVEQLMAELGVGGTTGINK
ncbi:HEAT repeat domain-containing protein [Lyngbya sp. CCY1209]|uniref:HEAT repeat domain-containing protein n=1 Tax=Lyngbya sp. CCY1209 TaxID=2886103 RepID=UPI002D210D7F|nr:HEAT repeat domain-containing protein [Lyngbya sp. CCY1209]MEB3884439.1 MFS transporter [Lyngbya sp. CCY1209]